MTTRRSSRPDPHALPGRARVVVIGGGVIGTSVAYHLAHLGITDVVLLERDRLTCGTTWHAAGLMVTFGSMSETSIRMRQYSRDLYTRLEAETGLATGFAPVGFIEVAADADRLQEYRRVAAFNRHLGVDVHEISPGEVKELFPLARTEDILAGFYVPDDGRVNPVDVTMSLAKGARQLGVRIVEGVPATGVATRNGAVSGVHTPYGLIEAEVVVNCAGMWARQLGEADGIPIPLQAAEHYYLVTEPVSGVDKSLPVLEDPGSYGYYREEGGGLLIGLFEPVSAPWHVDAIPPDASFLTLPPDWDRMAPFLQRAMQRVPDSLTAGVRLFFCGPESFTPDLAPVLGETPEVRNYFVAAGLNSIGILTGGGVGRAIAQWIVDGRPDIDVTGVHVDRLHPYQATPEYRERRTVEALGLVYAAHYPGRSMRTARGVKLSALHERLAAQGAYFRDVSGWESPDWYAGPGETPDPGELTWSRPAWFDRWAAEHQAAREGVIVMDMSFMAKFLVQGRDAGRVLDWLSANDVNGEPGRLTYTQWLNEAGTIEADLTVTKLSEDTFWVVASDTAHRHALTWLRRHIATFASDGGGGPDNAHAVATDVTSAYAQMNVQGPRSRELLQGLTTVDMSDAAFPYRAAREIPIGYARVLCVRVTYLGELGYELYVPTEQAVGVYDRIVAAGTPLGLRHAGLKALASLRMEKGYRDYGHDIDNTDSVLEAGLGFAVAPGKAFLGGDAVRAAQAAGRPRRRLVQVLLTAASTEAAFGPHDGASSGPQAAAEPLLHQGEVVYRSGEAVGYVRAASYGHTLGGAVGLAMVEAGDPVTPSWIDSAQWMVDVAGGRYPARVSLKPLYDPTNARVKA